MDGEMLPSTWPVGRAMDEENEQAGSGGASLFGRASGI
jgi:hypothetical protein